MSECHGMGQHDPCSQDQPAQSSQATFVTVDGDIFYENLFIIRAAFVALRLLPKGQPIKSKG